MSGRSRTSGGEAEPAPAWRVKTMKIEQLINPERVAYDAESTSKKRALEQLSALIAASTNQLTTEEIFESLLGRERLGSTGLGHGVALPHGRIQGEQEAVGAFVKLQGPVDYDAIDNQPVDLLFALLVPEHFTDEHLELLSELAEMFSDPEFLESLRHTEDNRRLYDLLTHFHPRTRSAPA